ncbi:putative histone-lysine N-methyltransferase PRDM6 isoform X2 [Oscarella lobularis]|uniref:putative histone-lysine N-methyltransferase PRDM6 isoform X2 n=1 Tax=Oscarella lobularis TaxID=121494 RepID=UPI003313D3B9
MTRTGSSILVFSCDDSDDRDLAGSIAARSGDSSATKSKFDMEEMPSLEENHHVLVPASRSDHTPSTPSDDKIDDDDDDVISTSPKRKSDEGVAFTVDNLMISLYGRQEIVPLDPNLVLASLDQGGRVDSSKVYFPKEVSLCRSSLPGDVYGVYTKLVIPAGTWMGPFQGSPVLFNQLMVDSKIDMMWEVFRDGQLVHYIDASQSPPSNWMKYIQCARNAKEQNMIVFQYKMNIFYRASRDIHPGEELLVWYGSSEYSLAHGVPTGIEEILGEDSPRIAGRQPLVETTMRHHAPSSVAVTAGGMPIAGTVPMGVGSVGAAPVPTYPLVPPIRQNGHGSGRPNVLSMESGLEMTSSSTIAATGGGSVQSSGGGGGGGGTNPDSPATRERDEWNLWKCGQCFRSFTQRIMLQNHVCESRADMPFHCGHCNRVFSTSNELRSHVISHSNDRPFVCGFCHRAFAGATTLANHMRTHTGEKPFKCPQCNKGFTQGTQLARHMRMPGECAGGAVGGTSAAAAAAAAAILQQYQDDLSDAGDRNQ